MNKRHKQAQERKGMWKDWEEMRGGVRGREKTSKSESEKVGKRKRDKKALERE